MTSTPAGTTAATSTVDRYIRMWNDPNTESRQAIIASTFTENATYRDPLMSGEGPSGINAMVEGVQERFPGYLFSRLGDIEQVGGTLRFSWQLAPEAGAALVRGTDFAILAADGRLSMVTGFLDQGPQT